MPLNNLDQIRTDLGVDPQLDAGLMLLRQTQAAIRDEVSPRAPIQLQDQIGGFCLESEAPAPLDDAFADTLLQRIARLEADTQLARSAAIAAGRAVQELLDLPLPLQDFAMESALRGGWRFVGRGVKAMTLATGGQLTTQLLRIEPGFGAPRHDHTGLEYTLVVKGAFDDGQNHYPAGEVAILRAGQVHRPIAQGNEPCFALTVEEGHVAYVGALGVLQRMLRLH
ncbi:MAG: hypothetical protein RLZZ157_1596 [Pseudomonadota bacterium]|jgi:putative transcriptional regulator